VVNAAGLTDIGILSEYDQHVQLTLASWVPSEEIRAVVDRARFILAIFADSDPIKAYPTDLGVSWVAPKR
jgi:hypothetical protein